MTLLQRSLGEALMFLGRLEEAAERLRSSIRNALRVEDDHAALEAHLLLVEVLTKMGNVEGALAVASEGEGLAAKLDDRFSRGQILALRAGILEHEGLYAEAMEDREEALFLAEQLGHPTFQAEALLGLGRVLVERGKFEAAEADLKRASELAAQIGLLDVEAEAVELAARVALNTGKDAVACERQGRLVELRRTQGDPSGLATALFELAWYVASSGARDAARDHLSEGQRILGVEEYDHAQLTAIVHTLDLLDGPVVALRYLSDHRSRDFSLLAETDFDMLADALSKAASEAKQP